MSGFHQFHGNFRRFAGAGGAAAAFLAFGVAPAHADVGLDWLVDVAGPAVSDIGPASAGLAGPAGAEDLLALFAPSADPLGLEAWVNDTNPMGGAWFNDLIEPLAKPFLGELCGLICDGADGTEAHPDGFSGGLLFGDGGDGWNGAVSGAVGGDGGAAGLLGGDGGEGGSSWGADGGDGGRAGLLFGVGGDGGVGYGGGTGGHSGVSIIPGKSGAAGDTADPGEFAYTFVNNSGASLYVTLYGQDPANSFVWVDAKGDETALTGPNQQLGSFEVTNGDDYTMPANLHGARLYISEGNPLNLQTVVTGGPLGYGVQGPSPTSTDPNVPGATTIFDWFEFAYGKSVDPITNQAIDVNFNGNTTQVDMFGIPYTYHLTQDAGSYNGHSYGASDFTEGVATPFGQVVLDYSNALVALSKQYDVDLTPWTKLIWEHGGDTLRLLAPGMYLSAYAADSPALNHWLDSEITDFWTKYASTEFTFNQTQGSQYTVTGQIDANNNFVYTVTPANSGDPNITSATFTLAKPSTEDAFASNNGFVNLNPTPPTQPLTQTISNDALAFLAQLGAAFNRGIAVNNTSDWSNPSTYYWNNNSDRPGGQLEPFNVWAWFFHQVPPSIDGRAYGFSYDDVNDQSTNRALPDPNAPTGLTFTIYPQASS